MVDQNLMEKTTIKRRPGTHGTLLALAALCAVLAPQLAQARGVFLCVSASGGKELTDTYRPGCKVIDVPGTIAAPPQRSGARAAARPANVATPADFPKVDNAQQKARDADRREILTDELRSEEARLAQLRAEYKNGEPERSGSERNFSKYQERVASMRDNVARAEKNVEALKREIANIK
jgi:hypothetical protein